MPSSAFTISGIKVSAFSASADLASEFGKDFGQTQDAPADTKNDIKLRIKLSRPPSAIRQKLEKLLPFKNGLRLRDFGERRLISYPEGAVLLYDYRNESACLWTEHYHLARELSYLCALSRAGILLDLKGLHRIHASAVQLNGHTAIICGPSGSGKSTLALLLALDHNASLYSDDFPLTDTCGKIFPFPARPAIGQDNYLAARSLNSRILERRKYGRKLLLEQTSLRSPEPALADCLIVLETKRAEKAELRPASKTAALAELMKHLVLGLGLPQIAELLLSASPRQNIQLALIALSRAGAAWRLASNARCYRLRQGASPEQAAGLVATLLSK